MAATSCDCLSIDQPCLPFADSISADCALLIPVSPAGRQVDFDRWRSESEDELEARDVINDYPDVYDRLLQEETAPKNSRGEAGGQVGMGLGMRKLEPWLA